MFTQLRFIPVAIVLTLAAPANVVAQDAPDTAAVQVTTPSSDAQPVANSAGPRLEHTAIAVRAASEPTESAVPQRRASSSRPVALMIVGGAAIVLGSVIGGDAGTLFAIGGAVALLYGLYLYLQ